MDSQTDVPCCAGRVASPASAGVLRALAAPGVGAGSSLSPGSALDLNAM